MLESVTKICPHIQFRFKMDKNDVNVTKGPICISALVLSECLLEDRCFKQRCTEIEQNLCSIYFTGKAYGCRDNQRKVIFIYCHMIIREILD
jgi:hypothetical protein